MMGREESSEAGMAFDTTADGGKATTGAEAAEAAEALDSGVRRAWVEKTRPSCPRIGDHEVGTGCGASKVERIRTSCTWVGLEEADRGRTTGMGPRKER